MSRDPEKQRASKLRSRAKNLGVPVDQLIVGRGNNPRSWGNHRSGPEHPNWSDDRMVSAEGYVKIRVGRDHPLADPNGYAYEHLVVWTSAGREKPPKGWVLHHVNEVKTDNRLQNLELKQQDRHGIDHASTLSDSQVVEIRTRYASGENTTELAEAFGVPFQSIWKIVKGKTRKSAGGPIQTGSLRGFHSRTRAEPAHA